MCKKGGCDRHPPLSHRCTAAASQRRFGAPPAEADAEANTPDDERERRRESRRGWAMPGSKLAAARPTTPGSCLPPLKE